MLVHDDQIGYCMWQTLCSDRLQKKMVVQRIFASKVANSVECVLWNTAPDECEARDKRPNMRAPLLSVVLKAGKFEVKKFQLWTLIGRLITFSLCQIASSNWMKAQLLVPLSLSLPNSWSLNLRSSQEENISGISTQ